MQDRHVFKETLRQALQSHSAPGQPMAELLLDASHPDPGLLRRVALQGYQLARHLPYCVAHLFFHCPLPRHKAVLLGKLFEQETGRLSETDRHVARLQHVLRALGISDAERDAARPLPATRALIDYQMVAVRDTGKYHVGAAAVLIAGASRRLEMPADPRQLEWLQRAGGLSPRDAPLFSTHQAAGLGLLEPGLDLVADYCGSALMQREALHAVGEACRLLDAVYDDLYRPCGRAGQNARAAALAA